MIQIYSHKYILSLFMLLYTSLSIAYNWQEQVSPALTINGYLSIGTQGVLSTSYKFVGLSDAQVSSQGITYFFDDFHNDGFFESSSDKSHSVFENIKEESKIISGESISKFHDITWNSFGDSDGFTLRSNLDVYGQMDFVQGIVFMDEVQKTTDHRTLGAIAVHNKSTAVGANDLSYVQGSIEKHGKHSYTFPIGDNNLYRPLVIAAVDCPKAAFKVKYVYGDHDFFSTRENKASIIKNINKQEYWVIDKDKKTTGAVFLSLSIDKRTLDISDNLEGLSIVQWNELLGIWEDKGGKIEKDGAYIGASVNLRPQTSVVTLAYVDKDQLLPGDVLVYNFVSANHDGKNDYLYIQNIHKYSSTQVEIYDRWGVKVFAVKDYDKYADGSTNVFTGMQNGKKLPSGTYYYVLKYQLGQKEQYRVITKSGNLHLETI
ncbi:gliding motility-associated C-terminal domain-containing protein [Myroides sp. LJL116]